MTIVTVGLDIAKQIFQAHGVDRSHETAVERMDLGAQAIDRRGVLGESRG
jgi:hypothetical protein